MRAVCTQGGRRLGALLVAVAFGAASAPAGGSETETVRVEARSFRPAELAVEPGDTVRWVHASDDPHSVTFDDGSFDSHPGCNGLPIDECFRPDDRPIERTFEEEGVFRYRCRVHPGMTGVVEVLAGDDDPDEENDEADDDTDDDTATTTTTGATTTTAPTTTTTAEPTTTTTRELSTSSTMRRTQTTVAAPSTVTIAPAEPPVLSADDDGAFTAETASRGRDTNAGTVGVVVAVLLAVAGAGGVLLWRLRPGRGGHG